MRVFHSADKGEREEIRDVVEKKIRHAHLSLEDRKAMLEQLEKLSPKRNEYSLRNE